MAENDFKYGGWNSYTLQCGMWLWNRDSKFTMWQHPAMLYVALGWHAIEFVQTSAILEFYIWFPFPHITAVDMSFCTSLRNFYPNRTTLGRKNEMKSPCTTSYTSLIEIIALNCLVFEKMSVFCIFATDRQTDRLTDKQTDKRTHSSDALSRCRCRERRRQTPVTGPTIITHRKTPSSRALVYG